jgi:hypothetical protein
MYRYRVGGGEFLNSCEQSISVSRHFYSLFCCLKDERNTIMLPSTSLLEEKIINNDFMGDECQNSMKEVYKKIEVMQSVSISIVHHFLTSLVILRRLGVAGCYCSLFFAFPATCQQFYSFFVNICVPLLSFLVTNSHILLLLLM